MMKAYRPCDYPPRKGDLPTAARILKYSEMGLKDFLAQADRATRKEARASCRYLEWATEHLQGMGLEIFPPSPTARPVPDLKPSPHERKRQQRERYRTDAVYREKRLRYQKERYRTDAAYREKRLRHANREDKQKRNRRERERYRADPVYREQQKALSRERYRTRVRTPGAREDSEVRETQGAAEGGEGGA